MKKLDTDTDSESSDSSDDGNDQRKVISGVSTATNSQIVLRQATALEYPTGVGRKEENEIQMRTKSKKFSKSKKNFKKT